MPKMMISPGTTLREELEKQFKVKFKFNKEDMRRLEDVASAVVSTWTKKNLSGTTIVPDEEEEELSEVVAQIMDRLSELEDSYKGLSAELGELLQRGKLGAPLGSIERSRRYLTRMVAHSLFVGRYREEFLVPRDAIDTAREFTEAIEKAGLL